MTTTDITAVGKTNMKGLVPDFSYDATQTKGVGEQEETYYDNPNFSKYYGVYLNDPITKKAIQAFATWVLGKGFESPQQAVLEGITGRGDEDFLSILWNAKVIAKVNGDSYTEIIRNDNGTLINLISISPQNIRVVLNRKGRIIRYEDRRTNRKFKPEQILHLSNDRVADEMGGDSVISSIQWSVEAKREAMEDWRRISHRSTIRVLYVDEDDTTRQANLKSNYADAIKKGELLIIPVKKEEASFEDLQLPPVEAFLAWMRYLDNNIFLEIGTPKVIMGSVESIPESGGKVSYLSYEQIYSRETRELESDLWNQLAIRVKFNNPASLMEGMNDEESKNRAQTGFQPNDVNAGRGK